MEPPRTLLEKIASYRPNKETAGLLASVPTLLLVGVSGAGKDTIKHSLLKSEDYHHIVSHTTRSPRKNHGLLEKDGVDYHFISYETAEHMLDNQGFVEAKRYGNNIYGTSVGEFRLAHDEQKIAVTDLEVQGVEEYMALAPQSVRPVFLLPPNYEIWQRRLIERYGENHQDHTKDIKLRIETAKKELEFLKEAGYFFAVINNDLNTTVQTVDKIAKTGKQDRDEKLAALKVAEDIRGILESPKYNQA